MRLLLAALLSMAIAAPLAARAEGEDELPGEGAEAPGFTLPVYNAEASGQARAGTMALVGDDAEDADTRLILVSFMASHCKPCRKELPFLQKMHESLKGKGLRIIGVSIDNEADGQKLMGEILKEAKVTFPVTKDQFNFVARRYLGNKVPLPSVFLVDRAGRILFVSRGYNEEISASLAAAVNQRLGAGVPGAKEGAK